MANRGKGSEGTERGRGESTAEFPQFPEEVKAALRATATLPSTLQGMTRVLERPQQEGAPVKLRRADLPAADVAPIWSHIRNWTEGLTFSRYEEQISGLFDRLSGASEPKAAGGRRTQWRTAIPFPGVDPYNVLKTATEVCFLSSVGTAPDADGNGDLSIKGVSEEVLADGRFDEAELEAPGALVTAKLLRPMATAAMLRKPREALIAALKEYLEQAVLDQEQRAKLEDKAVQDALLVAALNYEKGGEDFAAWNAVVTDLGIPALLARGENAVAKKLNSIRTKEIRGPVDVTCAYLDAIVRMKLGGWSYGDELGREAQVFLDLLNQRVRRPLMIELIWNYWQEEGMLVQTLNAISLRFQNRRAPGPAGALAMLDVDPLRPLSNLLWGYLQDEQHRLSIMRRAYEYDHQYGLRLQGSAVPQIDGVDSRSNFLPAFHNLLYRATAFYRSDDDTTVRADGFPVLNALKELHQILTEGAHNQYGDLPCTARQEMLMQQWLLARPEMEYFLSGRTMVDYPEKWMDRVDVVKKICGWNDSSIIHFNWLAQFGEQLLLSVRYGRWINVNSANEAANWARYWRSEVQGYVHAYRTVTGVDLASDTVYAQPAIRDQLPSLHLRRQLTQQTQGMSRRRMRQVLGGRRMGELAP